MNGRRIASALLALCLASSVLLPAQGKGGGQAQPDSAHGIPPPSHRSPSGVLRVWGHPQAAGWLAAQAEEFRGSHPGIRIEARLTGSDVGMAALYTGQADIVLMGREATESETKAFEWVYRYRPTAVPILSGSLDRVGQAPALVVFVHRDNPLEEVSLAQLDGIFGTAREHGWRDGQPMSGTGRGAERDLRNWGQLGLEGAWSKRPIRLYAPMAESGTGKYFRGRVLADSNRMHWAAITEFADPIIGAEDSGERILAALAVDPAGMAISSLRFARSEVKALRLSAEGGEAVAATASSLAAGTYPLARTVYAYINKPPGVGIDPQVLAWLQAVLDDASRDPRRLEGFLPLPPGRRDDAIRALADTSPQAQ